MVMFLYKYIITSSTDDGGEKGKNQTEANVSLYTVSRHVNQQSDNTYPCSWPWAPLKTLLQMTPWLERGQLSVRGAGIWGARILVISF